MLHLRPAPPLLLVACDSPAIQRVKPKLRLSSSALQVADQSADGAFQPQANEIAPRVFVSDLSTAQCRKAMAALGITHVVSVMPGNIELPHDVFTSTLQISIADMPFADLLSHLEDTSSFIQQALDSNPSARVLVHCAKGRSRSCSVAAAHLMAARGWTVEQAVAHVQQHRRIAQPNAGFIGQLHEYYDVLHGPLSASTSWSSGSDDYSDDASMPSPSDSD